jgi:hypothetical protein
VQDRDFTLETVRIYKKIFPEAKIIISTWEDENRQALAKIKSEKIAVILNEKPENGGPIETPNINLQIVSSLAGIRIAQELGCEYVLKTRTDQRIYRHDALDFFSDILDMFPVASGYKQKKRIAGVSLNTYQYRMYGMSDMTLFGSVEDMLLFWDVDLDNRKKNGTKDISLRGFAHQRFSEIYFVTEFMRKIGRDLKWTLRDSWEVFADHFCVIDQQSIELYWHKYKRHHEYRRSQYFYERTDKEMSFSSWLQLYRNLPHMTIDESILELSFGEKIPLTII